MMENISPSKASHLCVLVHGLWGVPEHLFNVAKVLRETYAEDELTILIAKRNSGSFTYDGVELGGERVCQEIEEEMEKLEREGHPVKKLSIVGYSLGGLVARYAVGLLDSRGIFENVEPVNFTTFATPHLGVRTPLRSWNGHLWNGFGARTLSMSGKQLFTVDNFRDTGRPLLAILADPSSIFMQGLAKFRRRSLYTNIVNDRSATYYTTAISKIDPFSDLERVKINYLSGTEDVILESDNFVEPARPKRLEMTPFSRFMMDAQTKIRGLPLMFLLVVLIPIGLVVYVINSGLQTIWSSRRIRLHEAGQAGIAISSYRMPFLIEMQGAVENVYENLNSAQSNEYLESQGDEESLDQAEPSSSNLDRPENSMNGYSVNGGEKSPIPGKSDTTLNTQNDKATSPAFPTLALSPAQFVMIDELDKLGWRKFPVHIHKVHHSHAAIIVRMNRTSFSEGFVVLRHWTEKEFLIS